jgi:hypothetical protein
VNRIVRRITAAVAALAFIVSLAIPVVQAADKEGIAWADKFTSRAVTVVTNGGTATLLTTNLSGKARSQVTIVNAGTVSVNLYYDSAKTLPIGNVGTLTPVTLNTNPQITDGLTSLYGESSNATGMPVKVYEYWGPAPALAQ